LSPCQDSPSIKLTYSAVVTSPLQVVMSALQTGVKELGNGLKAYSFEQRTTIPSYLIAIAAGNLVGREIGPRSTVWCEPEVIDAAAWEFTVSAYSSACWLVGYVDLTMFGCYIGH
jgi:aminopeptidase N